MDSLASAQEIRWIKRFRRLVKDMPPSMEVHLSAHSSVSFAPRGSYMRSMANGGDGGNCDKLLESAIENSHFIDLSSAL